MNTPEEPTQKTSQNTAAANVAEAHKLLTSLKQPMERHPELDEAITKLELALSALTLQTGGLL